MAMLLAAVFILSSFCIVISPSEEVYAEETKGTLYVETSPDFAPYDYMYGTEFTGIDMDILREVGRRINYNIEFRNNTFDSIILSVQQGKCDFGASGFTINDERREMINFSHDYAVIKQVVVAPIGLDITSEDDVRGKKISVQTGTSGAAYAETLSNNIVYQKGYSEVVLDILNGKAYCEVVDDAVAYAQIAAHPDKLTVYDVLTGCEPEYYGFVFNKDTAWGKELLGLVNGALDSMKADGTLDSIYQYYVDNGFTIDTPSYYGNEKVLFALTSDNGSYSYNNNGDMAGVDLDVLRAVANEMGYKLKFLTASEEDIQKKMLGYQDGVKNIHGYAKYFGAFSFDAGADYADGLVMSDAYTKESLIIVNKAGYGVASLDDLNGKTISVVKGCVAVDYLKEKGATIIECDSELLAMKAITDDTVDYAAVDRAVAIATIAKEALPLSTSDILVDAPGNNIGFLFNEDSPELLAAFNAALAKVVENGTVEAITNYYANNGYSLSTHSYYYDDSEPSWWDKLVDRFERNFLENDRYQYIFEGLGNTLKITVIALIIGIAIGIVLAAIMSLNAQTGKLRILSTLCRGYVTIIRGTPAVVQLLIIYYVVFASASLNPVLVAAAAFGINSGAYVAEIVRSGMNSIPKGQTEAARCLGLSNSATMKSVVVPQAIRNILPALGNESISLLKETSIAGFIGVIDLTRGADIIRGQTYDALMPLILVALIYLAIVLILQFLVKRLERRLNNAY